MVASFLVGLADFSTDVHPSRRSPNLFISTKTPFPCVVLPSPGLPLEWPDVLPFPPRSVLSPGRDAALYADYETFEAGASIAGLLGLPSSHWRGAFILTPRGILRIRFLFRLWILWATTRQPPALSFSSPCIVRCLFPSLTKRPGSSFTPHEMGFSFRKRSTQARLFSACVSLPWGIDFRFCLTFCRNQLSPSPRCEILRAISSLAQRALTYIIPALSSCKEPSFRLAVPKRPPFQRYRSKFGQNPIVIFDFFTTSSAQFSAETRLVLLLFSPVQFPRLSLRLLPSADIIRGSSPK